MVFVGTVSLTGCQPSYEFNSQLNKVSADSKEGTRIIDNKSQILSYIASMPSRDAVISGQQCGDGDNIQGDYDTYMTSLYQATGKYPAIAGADYGYKSNNLLVINQKLTEHWNAGGLVTINWSADYPWDAPWNSTSTPYNCRVDPVANDVTINLYSLHKNAQESAAKTNYRTELDRVGKALQQLKNAGIVVIWRPFHEMNTNFFWWGINQHGDDQRNAQEYKDFWNDLYTTLTVDYGLDNLIWTYSPWHDLPGASWTTDLRKYYPGDDYVDLVGEDYYAAAGGVPDLTALQSLGKPVVLAECGPDAGSFGNYDEVAMTEHIKGKVCYFLQWHSWSGAAVAIKDNKNYNDMMWSGSVITRDELP